MHNKEYRVFKKVLLHIALLIVVLISIFPFIWMLTGATNKSVDVTGGVLRFGKSLGYPIRAWVALSISVRVTRRNGKSNPSANGISTPSAATVAG